MTPLPTGMAAVHGKLMNADGSAATNCKVKFQLVYCGGNLGRVTSTGTIISPDPFFVEPAADGTWSVDVYGNDVIVCGSDDTGPSRWRITYVYNGEELPSTDYQIHSGATFSPDSAVLCSPDTPGVTDINCAVDYPYVTPPPPPIGGPPGPAGPTGPQGPAGSGAATGQYFVGVGHLQVPATNGAQLVAVDNQVRCFRFTLPIQVTVAKISYRITSAAGSPTIGIGIYDSSGNALLRTSFTVSDANVHTNSITPVIIGPADLWLAQSTDDAANTQAYVDSFIHSQFPDIANAAAVRFGIAANNMSGGVMPATLGIIAGTSVLYPPIAPVFSA